MKIDLLSMSDGDAARYILDRKYKFQRIPDVDAELSKAHPIFGDYHTLAQSIYGLDGLIAGSGLSDGLENFCYGQSSDRNEYVKAYVAFLIMIGADGFAKILARAIEKCVPYDDAITDLEYEELTDGLWVSFYETDRVIDKMGAYFKSRIVHDIAKRNIQASNGDRCSYSEALRLIEKCHEERSDVLDLRELGLKILPPEIGELVHLKHLDLEANQLKSIPSEIGKLTALEVLNLSANPHIKLPLEIASLTSLKKLNLSWNRLGKIPPQIFQLTSLNELVLWENNLNFLPKQIGNLTSLTVLELVGNWLNRLPPEMARLTSLKKLNLGRNHLGSFPQDIVNLTDLTHLVLAVNPLKVLPEVITNLRSLALLDLRGGELTDLPKGLMHLPKLSQLLLHSNPYLKLPAELLGDESMDDDWGVICPASPQQILIYYFSQKH